MSRADQKISPLRFGRIHPIVVGILAVTLLAGTVGVYLVTRPKPNDDPNGGGGTNGQPGVTEAVNEFDSADQAWKTIQQASAMLENEQFLVQADDQDPKRSGLAYATDSYERLVRSYPKEILPVANLAIAKYIAFKNVPDGTPAADKRQVFDEAIKAANAWSKLSPESGVPDWLKGSARLAMNGDSVDQQVIDDYQAAVEKNDRELVFLRALYVAAAFASQTESLPVDKVQPIYEQTLGRAFELHAGNLAIALDYAELLAKQENPELEQVLLDLKPDLEALANQRILEGRRNDPRLIWVDLLEAVKAKEWRKSQILIRPLKNLSSGYLYSLANAQADGHPLGFLVRQMSPTFMSKLSAEDPASMEAINVNFKIGSQELTYDGMVKQILTIDVDLDNLLDLVVLTGKNMTAFQGTGSADAPFETVLFRYEFAAEESYVGVLSADLDRDDKRLSPSARELNAKANEAEAGNTISSEVSEFDKADVDFVLYGPSGFKCLRNELDEASNSRSLIEVEQLDEGFTAIKDVTAACLIDFDHDSDLDIVAASANRLHCIIHLEDKPESNLFQYKEHSEFSDLPEVSSPIHSLQAGDWDRDVDIDVLVCDEQGQVFGVLSNYRHGRFTWQDLTNEFQEIQFKKKAIWIEADGNVSWDLLGLTDNAWQLQLTETIGAENIRDLQVISGEISELDDFIMADLDNDGRQDFVGWGPSGMQILQGKRPAQFELSESLNFDTAGDLNDSEISHVAAGDLDADGDLDLVVAFADKVRIFSNEGGNKNHWLTVRSIGTQDNAGRANFHAINSLLELRTNGHYQAQFVTEPRTHFGLGSNEKPDLVRFIWPNGMPQGLLVNQADTTIRQEMYLKGSCPFIYAWNGERYEFVTDCLWAAPIGLQFAEGVTAPTRSWEYLKISGEALKPIENEYRIQLTEELWEAAYFDHVQLICIDHPADVEIFSNEKVGPPSISQFQIHGLSKRRLPRSATNQHGEDVMGWLAKEDRRFLKGYDRKLRQGLTTPQVLELDLGDLDSPEQLTLFLTGWIQPTDTSLNIAFSQNPEVDGPVPPSLWVVNEAGVWQQLDRPMGFPGGKTKTIAVDLSDAFPTSDYRIQLRTTAEIYWDTVFFTTEAEAVDSSQFVKQDVLPIHADLHYRGFSERHPILPKQPETFDYSRVSTDPKWPPMLGNFTRYGDVTELITRPDDQMAILASGDEMTVRFPVPARSVPAGWKRDFILHCVGYDKDADLNTIEGQSVEPLPHRGMKQYPYGLEDDYPRTPDHEEYKRRFQTRNSSWERFWRGATYPTVDIDSEEN